MPRNPEHATRQTALRRYGDHRRDQFIKLYDWWTALIDESPALASDPVPDYDALSLAAQIEAYAARRRREAACHRIHCKCTPCAVRRYHEARHAVELRAAA